jgi:hypothetical protein
MKSDDNRMIDSFQNEVMVAMGAGDDHDPEPRGSDEQTERLALAGDRRRAMRARDTRGRWT